MHKKYCCSFVSKVNKPILLKNVILLPFNGFSFSILNKKIELRRNMRNENDEDEYEDEEIMENSNMKKKNDPLWWGRRRRRYLSPGKK